MQLISNDENAFFWPFMVMLKICVTAPLVNMVGKLLTTELSERYRSLCQMPSEMKRFSFLLFFFSVKVGTFVDLNPMLST